MNVIENEHIYVQTSVDVNSILYGEVEFITSLVQERIEGLNGVVVLL